MEGEEGGRAEISHIGLFAETQPGQDGDMLDPDLFCWWSGASQKSNNPPPALLFFQGEKIFIG